MKARFALVVIAVLFLASCFDPPVKEAMVLRFLPGGKLEVRVTTKVASSGEFGQNGGASRRIADARDALLSAQDLWGTTFLSMEPDRERRLFDYTSGELRELARTLDFPDAEAALPALFARLPVNAFVLRADDVTTFEIHPAGTLRATDAERRQVKEALDRFSERVAAYVKATASLFRAIGNEPGRARALFAHLFEDRLEPGTTDELPISKEEKALVDALGERMGDLLDVLAVGGEEAYSLDELSQRVYSPFPMALSVEVAGRVLEREGFTSGDEGRFNVPQVSLWGALGALEGRWVSPEPILVTMTQDGGRRGGRLDLDALVAETRLVRSVPDASSVRAALEAGLAPAPVYRLRWKPEKAR